MKTSSVLPHPLGPVPVAFLARPLLLLRWVIVRLLLFLCATSYIACPLVCKSSNLPAATYINIYKHIYIFHRYKNIKGIIYYNIIQCIYIYTPINYNKYYIYIYIFCGAQTDTKSTLRGAVARGSRGWGGDRGCDLGGAGT